MVDAFNLSLDEPRTGKAIISITLFSPDEDPQTITTDPIENLFNPYIYQSHVFEEVSNLNLSYLLVKVSIGDELVSFFSFPAAHLRTGYRNIHLRSPKTLAYTPSYLIVKVSISPTINMKKVILELQNENKQLQDKVSSLGDKLSKANKKNKHLESKLTDLEKRLEALEAKQTGS
eukprot:TRINITY_DN7723_c0_g1_i1.p1 TRINITY_DN7723_c0_g1~~TRINITY_DN7723_c0_g1_i1.p1  ORF type:complete len:175 (+),score=40.90 TRINITY_DN7723_c0_g1_i1:285-809(+)